MNEQAGSSTPPTLTREPLPGRIAGRAASRPRPSDGAHVPATAGLEPSKQSVSSVDLPRLVDIHGIADHLGVNVRHVRRLVAERRIPYVKWGNLLRFDPQEISRWLGGCTVDPLVHARPDHGRGEQWRR